MSDTLTFFFTIAVCVACRESLLPTLQCKRPGGRADGTLIYESGKVVISGLDFMTTSADVGVRRITGTFYPVQGSSSSINHEKKPAYNFNIEVHMKNSPKFMERINSIEAKDWRSLLLDDITGESDPEEYDEYTEAYRDKVMKKRVDGIIKKYQGSVQLRTR